jgi:hypothetical protein
MRDYLSRGFAIGDRLAAMRVVWFFPLTYIAGIDGFGWFVPYLLVVSLAAAMLSYANHRRRVGPAVRRIVVPDLLELEAAPA